MILLIYKSIYTYTRTKTIKVTMIYIQHILMFDIYNFAMIAVSWSLLFFRLFCKLGIMKRNNYVFNAGKEYSSISHLPRSRVQCETSNTINQHQTVVPCILENVYTISYVAYGIWENVLFDISVYYKYRTSYPFTGCGIIPY